MNKQILTVIERVIHSDKQHFPLNLSLKYLHQQYNIGRTLGNKLEITQQDKAELLALVKRETGVDLEQISVADFSTMHREAALAYALDEKRAGQAVEQAVKKDRLALKSLTGMALKINGQSCSLPHCGYLDIALADIIRTAHNCILLIENYRCFDSLKKMQLKLPNQYADPLVLFRGDNYYNENTVWRLLAQLDLSVLVMADLDPQSLIIAQSFPNVVGLMAPCLADLELMFKDEQKVNPKLYAKQLANCQNAFANSPHALIRQLWKIMKSHQAGLVQEYWLQEGCQLVVYHLTDLKLKSDG